MAIKVSRKKVSLYPGGISKPSTPVVMFWRRDVKKATSKSSLKAINLRFVRLSSSVMFGGGPLGRVPPAALLISKMAEASGLGKPLERSRRLWSEGI